MRAKSSHVLIALAVLAPGAVAAACGGAGSPAEGGSGGGATSGSGGAATSGTGAHDAGHTGGGTQSAATTTSSGGQGGSIGSGGAGGGATGWTATRVGSPDWEPAAPHQFSAVLGDKPCTQSAFDFYDAVGQPNHKLFEAPEGASVGPASPHAPPYDQEFGPLLAQQGLVDRTTFHTGDFTQPTGIVLSFVLVPLAGAPSGVTADGPNLPMISNGKFPIVSDTALYRDGTLFDRNQVTSAAGGWLSRGKNTYPAPPTFFPHPHVQVQGASHVPLFFGDNMSFSPGGSTEGHYEWRISIRDAANEGWDVVAPFTVDPPPSGPDADAGTCADLANDPLNCGACGHSCLGGTCTQGRCQAGVFDGSQSSPVNLVVGPTEAYVAVWEGAQDIVRIPLAGGPATSINAGVGQYPLPIALDATHLYWGEGTVVPVDGGVTLRSYLLPSGPSATVTGAASALVSLTSDGNALYWEDQGALWSVPVTGGTPTQLTSNVLSFSNIVAGPQALYWIDVSNSLVSLPKTGGTPSTVATGFHDMGLNNGQSMIAVDGQSAYVVDGWAVPARIVVSKVDLASGSKQMLGSVPGGLDNFVNNGPGVVAREGSVIFMTNGIFGTSGPCGTFTCNNCGRIYSVPEAGGQVTLVADGILQDQGIAVDATAIYFTSRLRNTVSRVAR